MKTHNFDELILDIYNTSLQPESWGDVLERVAHAMGANSAIILEVLEGTDHNQIITPHYSRIYNEPDLTRYLSQFGEYELLSQKAFAKLSAQEADMRLITEDEVVQTFPHPSHDIVKNALLDFEVGYRAGTVLNKDSLNLDRFGVQFTPEQGAPDLEQLRTAQLLLPHISKALRIGRPLQSAEFYAQKRFESRMNLLDFGVAILTPKGELAFHNRSFQNLLDKGEVFKLSPQKILTIKNAQNQEKFIGLLQSLDIHQAKDAHPRNQSIFSHYHNDGRDFGVLIEVAPLDYHPALERFPAGSRIVTSFEWTGDKAVNYEVFQQFFKISKSEIETLQALVAGMTNGEIADIRFRSVETINSQVKTLFRKTNTRNRAELVHLAVSINSPFSKQWLDLIL